MITGVKPWASNRLKHRSDSAHQNVLIRLRLNSTLTKKIVVHIRVH